MPSGSEPISSPTISNFWIAIAYAAPSPNGTSLPTVMLWFVIGAATLKPIGSLFVNVSLERTRTPPLTAMRNRPCSPNSLSRMPITCGTNCPLASPMKRLCGVTVGRYRLAINPSPMCGGRLVFKNRVLKCTPMLPMPCPVILNV